MYSVQAPLLRCNTGAEKSAKTAKKTDVKCSVQGQQTEECPQPWPPQPSWRHEAGDRLGSSSTVDANLTISRLLQQPSQNLAVRFVLTSWAQPQTAPSNSQSAGTCWLRVKQLPRPASSPDAQHQSQPLQVMPPRASRHFVPAGSSLAYKTSLVCVRRMLSYPRPRYGVTVKVSVACVQYLPPAHENDSASIDRRRGQAVEMIARKWVTDDGGDPVFRPGVPWLVPASPCPRDGRTAYSGYLVCWARSTKHEARSTEAQKHRSPAVSGESP
ncbi:hypothetical protein EDB81DRAFT_502539 [Dactylonectria macrodidyma]|uniref:Uncharacterized protein n=1 Tax=Dactylonectria macrodidyma TaxID=307937 RepID=A0A9P9ERM8_9HYPO|nr:hypothetical protein EDB81DRAFT_502539 [Dactylonectria macrodidyma]